MNTPPTTRYARDEALHLARRAPGENPASMSAASGSGPQLYLPWFDPAIAPCLRKLAPFGRFIFNDNQGAALSDPGQGSAAAATCAPGSMCKTARSPGTGKAAGDGFPAPLSGCGECGRRWKRSPIRN